MNRTRQIWGGLSVLLACELMLILSGCSHSDLSGSQSVRSRSSASSQPAEQAPLTANDVANEKPVVEQASAVVPVQENPQSVTADDKPAPEPGKIEILIKEKKFRPDKKTGALLVTYDDLDLMKVMNMKDVTMEAKELMPDWLKGLDGKQIRLRGFMRPPWESVGLKRFVLARDTQACCFGPNPKIDYLVEVQLKKGTTTNYISESHAFDVVGTFRIEPEGEGTTLLGLYRMEDAQIFER